MRRVLFTVLTAIATLLAPTAGTAQEIAADQLAWLSGSWTASLGETVVEEVWLPPRGNTLIGMNRTVRGQASVTYEFLRIARNDGLMVYFASPGGRYPPTEFALVDLAETRVVFSNPANDFPQRITYVRESDQLTATISGRINGEPLELNWYFRPTDAAAEPAPGDDGAD